MIKSIAVFCGSSSGENPIYTAVGKQLGKLLAQNNIRVIYGGAKIGVMGAIAEGALEEGGQVIGIIPGFLKTKEVAHDHLSELIIVENMHDRKLLMHKMSDAVITLPGGWGTMEELFEMLTWAQLGLHSKPIGLLNINNYYDSLLKLCDNMVQEKFLPATTRSILLDSNDYTQLLSLILNFVPIPVKKWITEKDI